MDEPTDSKKYVVPFNYVLHFKTSYKKLEKLLGEPTDSEGKISTEWRLKLDGKNYRIYDYNATSCYDEDGKPSMKEFRNQKTYVWHINIHEPNVFGYAHGKGPDLRPCVWYLKKHIEEDEYNLWEKACYNKTI